MRFKYVLHKYLNWEYWPDFFFYAPVSIYFFWNCLKAKSLYFFSATNPSIQFGGMAGESKWDVYQLLPKRYIPKTVFVPKLSDLAYILKVIDENGIQFPVIAKPDIGGKGMCVEVIHTADQLGHYQRKFNADYLIQELVKYPNEVGIFYVRIPGEGKGKITGIVEKIPMIIEGDGLKKFKKLIDEVPRYYFQREYLKSIFENEWETVLSKGENICLSRIGNHARGSKFNDITAKKNQKLEAMIDDLSQSIEGFYYGRYDIMYHTWEDLALGKNFSIIELNGAGSGPTHMFDPRHSVFWAWKELIRHWQLMYSVAKKNKKLGYNFMSFAEGRVMLKREAQMQTIFRNYNKK